MYNRSYFELRFPGHAFGTAGNLRATLGSDSAHDSIVSLGRASLERHRSFVPYPTATTTVCRAGL